jgi:hypothetical protein
MYTYIHMHIHKLVYVSVIKTGSQKSHSSRLHTESAPIVPKSN